MKTIAILLILVIASVLSFSGCHNLAARNQQERSSGSIEIYSDNEAVTDAIVKYDSTGTRQWVNKRLSDQFDIELFYTRFFCFDDHYNDRNFVKLTIMDKISGTIVDSLEFFPEFYYDFIFNDPNSVRSYTTGVNKDKEIEDNYFGDVVISDLDFDGRDDIAVVGDAGGNGGPTYRFYIQGENRKFVLNGFLTDTMEFFPTEMDPRKRVLTTYVHASAVSMSRNKYQWCDSTNRWMEIGYKIIGY